MNSRQKRLLALILVCGLCLGLAALLATMAGRAAVTKPTGGPASHGSATTSPATPAPLAASGSPAASPSAGPANRIPTLAPASPTPAPTPTAATPAISPIYWGVSMPGVPGELRTLSSWEQDVAGKGVSIVHWGHFWGLNGGYRAWSDSALDQVRAHGAIPMISWTPEDSDPSRWQLRKIIQGEHDAYIRQFATDARNWGHPFFLRIMHEMNGNWGYPWQEDTNGNGRGEFVRAWRHIVDIFHQVGVTNASYVWCPNIESPDSDTPAYSSLYPGDGYVDWTCLDGYNWGTNRPEGWATFDQVFSRSYREILRVAPSKPVMIGEFGSAQEGGSKADWIASALAQIRTSYPQVRAVVYYNRLDRRRGMDWRIEPAAPDASAWRAGIADSYYSSNSLGDITGQVPIP
ncbi:MAG: glycoside hydrolase family 26 protein [Nitrososphaerales archaeon]